MNLKMGRRPVSYWLGGAQGAEELGSVRCGWHTWAKQLGNPGCTQGCRAEQKSCKCSGSPEESGQRNSRGVYRQPGAVDPASVAVGHREIDGATTMLQQRPSGRGPDSSSFLLSKLCIFQISPPPPSLPSLYGDHCLHAAGTVHLSPKEEIQLKTQQQHDHN